jgi:hypothetical protein
VSAAALACTLPGSVAAQSAADKATARELAKQGILLYDQRSYEKALDRLERAESLYSAPVHRLYIARTQAAMGRLVEAAESYRALARTELGPRAPHAFRKSVDDGREELGRLEPRIPGLTVQLRPSQPPGLALSIDGESVSPAIVGVRRPINPGTHRISASAPGYGTQEATIEIGEAQTKWVSLELEAAGPEGEGSRSADAGSTAAEGNVAGAAPPTSASGRSAPAEPDRAKLLLGLRLSGQKPAGALYTSSDGSTRSVSDRFGPGGGLELRAGAEFARYFAAVLYFEGYSVAPGPAFDAPEDAQYATKISTSPTIQAVGLGLSAGSSPGGAAERLRIFAELGVSILQDFKTTIDAKSGAADNRLSCTITQTYSGGALRLGAGASYALSGWLRLGPYVMASIGRFTSLKGGVDCGGDVLPEDRLGTAVDFEAGRKLDAEEQATHSLFGIGVSADAVIPL